MNPLKTPAWPSITYVILLVWRLQMAHHSCIFVSLWKRGHGGQAIPFWTWPGRCTHHTLIFSSLQVLELESHACITQKRLGNGGSSKEPKLGILFLKGRTEWCGSQLVVSFMRKWAQVDWYVHQQSDSAVTLRKVCRTESGSVHTLSEHSMAAGVILGFVASPTSHWINTWDLQTKIRLSILFIYTYVLYVFLSTDTCTHVISVPDNFMLGSINWWWYAL